MNGKYIRLAQSLAQKEASLSAKENYKVPKEGVEPSRTKCTTTST